MKPRDLLLGHIEKYLILPLSIRGFKYSKSKMKFARKTGDFNFYFHFSLSKWNYEDNCSFWTVWYVYSDYYSKWYENEWGTKPINNLIIGYSDWNIPCWSRDVTNRVCLTNTKRDENEFKEFTENVFNVGIPFFEPLNNWEMAAEYALSNGRIPSYDKVCDFYMISGQKDKAKEVLSLGVKILERNGIDPMNLMPEIDKRLNKYFKTNTTSNFV